MHLEIAKEWKEMDLTRVTFGDCRKVDCFQLGWPMREDGDFFKPPDVAGPKFAVSAVCIPLFSSVFGFLFLLHSRIDMAMLM
jgi:hypothetical protein